MKEVVDAIPLFQRDATYCEYITLLRRLDMTRKRLPLNISSDMDIKSYLERVADDAVPLQRYGHDVLP